MSAAEDALTPRIGPSRIPNPLSPNTAQPPLSQETFMPILLPPDPGAYFRRFSACAHIDEPTGAMLRLVQNDDDIEKDAVYAGLAYHVAASKWSNGIGHIHFDIAKRSELPDDFNPDTDLDAVLASLDGFRGQEVSVSTRVRFVVPLADLPKSGIIGALQGVSTNLKGVDFALTGARMSPDGELFSSLEWRLGRDNNISVTLYIQKSSVINDEYLVDIMRIAVGGFNRFVLEKEGG